MTNNGVKSIKFGSAMHVSSYRPNKRIYRSHMNLRSKYQAGSAVSQIATLIALVKTLKCIIKLQLGDIVVFSDNSFMTI